MGRPRRILYGWRNSEGDYCISRIPPDLPQVPRDVFPSIAGAENVAQQRRAEIIWTGTAAHEKARLSGMT